MKTVGESQNANEKQQGERTARLGDHQLRGQGLKIGKLGEPRALEACVNVPVTKCNPEGVAAPSRVPCPQTAWQGAGGADAPVHCRSGDFPGEALVPAECRGRSSSYWGKRKKM